MHRWYVAVLRVVQSHFQFIFCGETDAFEEFVVLGDPGSDSGGEGKSKRATEKKNCEEKSSALDSPPHSRLFLAGFFRRPGLFIDFPSPPLSVPGSPRMRVRRKRHMWKTENTVNSRFADTSLHGHPANTDSCENPRLKLQTFGWNKLPLLRT